MRLQIDRKLVLAVASTTIIVIAVAGMAVASTRRLVQDARLVSRTHELRLALSELSRRVDAAEGDVRGYVFSSDSAYLLRYRANVAASEAALRRVESLSVDNVEQQARLAVTRELIASGRAAFDSTVILGVGSPHGDAWAAARLAINERLSARVDSAVNAADMMERTLLAARSHRQVASERFVTVASLVATLAVLGLALAFGRSIRRDFTGRLRAEAALRASEAKYAGILELAADAIITIDERRSIIHFNRGAESIFGYGRSEVIGQPLEMLLPPRFVDRHVAYVQSFAAGEEKARHMNGRGEIQGRRKNGEEFIGDASISKLQTENGLLLTAVLRDVTERKRREDHDHALAVAGGRLAQSLAYEDTLAAVTQLPTVAMSAWCVLHVAEDYEDGGVTTLRRYASHHPDPVVTAALKEWVEKPIDLDSPDIAVDVLRTREVLRIPEVSDDWLESHVDGPRQIEIAHAMGMRSLIIAPLVARDRALAVWTIGSPADHAFDDYDVAVTKALAERAALAIENATLLRDAQRAASARDNVLSVVSHDLRNPLSAVAMLARRVAEDRTTDDDRRSISAHILTSVDWMHRLMQDLLDVASIEAGKLSMELEPQLPHQLAESAIGMFVDRAAAQGIMLRTEVPTDLPWVMVDAGRVVQVLGNVLGNALKFTSAGGVVTLGARPEGDDVLMWVQDTGAGIPAADLPHVFDRFWHARRNSATHGTGLGLAIAQGIVRAHGGRLWVTSEPEQGSTFFLTLASVKSKVATGLAQPSHRPLP